METSMKEFLERAGAQEYENEFEGKWLSLK